MSTTVPLPPLRASTIHAPSPSRASSGPDLVGAFQAIGEAILGDVELDDVLRLVIGELCSLLGIRRGSLYLRDPESGLFRGQVGGATRDVDARVKRLVCGLEADRFTQEIMTTRAPVFIPDAQHDPRPIRSTMREWQVRSMLGVPMIAAGEVQGLLFLDDLDRPRVFSPEDQRLAAAFANMAAVAITAAKRTSELRETVRVVSQQNRLLRRAATIDERLTSQAAAGATIRDIASTLADLTGRPCAVYDGSLRRIAVGPGPAHDLGALRGLDEAIRRDPEVRSAVTNRRRSRSELIGPFPSAGLHQMCLVAPVVTRDHSWGYVLVGDGACPLGPVDRLAASRAATLIALHISIERGATELEAYAREAFVRRLIDDSWSQRDALDQARLHGMQPEAPHAVVILAAGDHDAGLDPMSVEGAAAAAQLNSVWVAQTETNTLTMIVELPGGDRAAEFQHDLRLMVSRLGKPAQIRVAISERCTSLEDLRAGYQQANRILSLLRMFATRPESPSMLRAADVGAGALLLAGTEPSEADRFVRCALGPLATSRGERSDELLQTVHTYLVARGIRKTAAACHVHENTIRYRLGKFAEATGLDVLTDTSAQVTAQVALLILSLQGRITPLTSV